MKKISWEQIDEAVAKLSSQLRGVSLSSVYGIPRGGLIPAVMLSHKLNKPLSKVPEPLSLVVDEMCDSGEQLSHFKQKRAVLFLRKGARTKPDFYAEEIETDEWLIFPWEEP